MVGAKGVGDETAFTKHAVDLAQLSSLIKEGFKIQNSLLEGTKARPGIWQDYEQFQDKAQDLMNAAISFTETGTD